MSSQILLSGGDKYYSYSGVLFGDVSVPASINMITIDNTGLKDSYVKIEPYYAQPIATGPGDALGFEVKLNDVTIIKSQAGSNNTQDRNQQFSNLFVPRQSKLEILSLNTANNNTQERGCTLIGYYL